MMTTLVQAPVPEEHPAKRACSSLDHPYRPTLTPATTAALTAKLPSPCRSPSTTPKPKAPAAHYGLIRLQAELFQSVVISRGPEGNRFIPRDAVERIMRFAPVLGAIRDCLPDLTDELAEYWAARICGDRDLLGLGERPRPAVKLFATLVLCGMGSEIVHLLREGITDSDLPLQIDLRAGRLLKRLPEKKRNGRILARSAMSVVESFGRWEASARSRFYDLQSLVLAPFFTRGATWGRLLSERDQMPVIESDVAHRTTDVAHIWRVKFHPAHHNLSKRTVSGEEPNFGIQRIHNPEFASYEAEVRYLGQYLQGSTCSQHVVQLLTWFKHWGQLYLVYFWSPGDLGMYWKLSRPRMTYNFVLWFAKQWEGIAAALCRIRKLPVAPSKPKASGLQLRTAAPTTRQQAINSALSLGHATFTPQNILWFPHDSFDGCSDPNGILQLGVMGSCFSGLERERLFRTATHEPFSPNRSITYAAPEQILERDPLMGQRRSDIWSLGCIFLEAITWLILGPLGVERDFPEARVWLPSAGSKRVYDITDDGFFCVTMNEGDVDDKTTPVAIVNPGVTEWIKKLRAHPRCTAYLDEFLDLIDNGMLVVEGKGEERISAGDLASVLGCLREKAERSEEFALKPKGMPSKGA